MYLLLFINKTLLAIEIIPIVILLLFTLPLLSDSRVLFILISVMSILSMTSLIYIIIKTIASSEASIERRFIYLSHLGVFITIFGGLVLLVLGNQFKEHWAEPPFSIFIFGVIALVPYFHVMVINKFFYFK